MNNYAQAARPSVFEYENYRDFLADSYRYHKATFSNFSFRYLAKRAGFTSPNFLKLVIEGQRNLSSESAEKFAQAFKLSKPETEFFIQLVSFNQAKSSTERTECARKMIQSKGFQKIRPLHQAEYAYYANWYYIPVRELVGFSLFQEDPDWIARTIVPAIDPEQAAQALEDLEALGLIVRGEDGRLRQAQRTVTTANEVSSSAIAQYHKEMLRMAAQSIDAVPREKREISAACVPVSRATAAKIKTMIQDFRSEVLALAGEDQDPETVYQIGIQLFPLSQWDDKGE